MANINTLIVDCQEVLKTKGWFTPALAKEFSRLLTERLAEQYSERQGPPTLRLSRLGPQCPCSLWHSIHSPELAEPFEAWVENKFTMGHMVEVWAITLMQAAGHTVEGAQDEVELDGVLGHRDCIVDGCVVDVKSTNARGYQDFKNRPPGKDFDTFGYLSQLDGYVVASLNDPRVKVKNRGYLLPVHKELGHFCLFEHEIRHDYITRRVDEYKRIIALDAPPACTCTVVTDGSSGNQRLDFPSDYNPFKFACFPHLRKFIYSKGPIYFTKVVKTPSYQGVPLTELDRFGKVVYRF